VAFLGSICQQRSGLPILLRHKPRSVTLPVTTRTKTHTRALSKRYNVQRAARAAVIPGAVQITPLASCDYHPLFQKMSKPEGWRVLIFRRSLTPPPFGNRRVKIPHHSGRASTRECTVLVIDEDTVLSLRCRHRDDLRVKVIDHADQKCRGRRTSRIVLSG